MKEFLEPQLRAAQSRTVEARFELTFTDGLAMDGDAAETLANGLCRFASGAAHVSATAEAKPLMAHIERIAGVATPASAPLAPDVLQPFLWVGARQ